MITISYNLRDSKIYLILRINGDRVIRYSTKHSCKPIDFDKKKHRIKPKKDDGTNALLDGTEKFLRQKVNAFLETNNHHNPDSNEVRDWLDIHYKRKEVEKPKSVIEDFREWIKNSPTEGTGRSRGSCLFQLVEFSNRKFFKVPKPKLERSKAQIKQEHDIAEKKVNVKLTYNDFSRDFFIGFYSFLLEARNERTSNVYLTNLKSFLGLMHRMGSHENDSYKTYRPKDYQNGNPEPTEKKQAPVLTKEEIREFREVKLTSEKLENARQIFLLMLASGVRYDDIEQVIPSNSGFDEKQGMEIISFVPGKTKRKQNKVFIPLSETVKSIWKKYDGKIEAPEYHTLKGRIRNIFKLCNSFKVGDRWKTISLHSSRRTFLTDLYNKGYKPVSLMNISGHQDFQMFLNYIGAPATKEFPEIVKDIDSMVSNLRIA